MAFAIRLTGICLALVLGACTSQADGVAEAVVDPVAGTAGADACGASARQGFVGQHADALNDVDLPEGTRVLFPGTAATMDFRPDRLNFVIDGSDGIERIYCG